MILPKIDIDRFLDIFDIPVFMRPWLDRFFEDAEIELVLLLSQKPLKSMEIAAKWRPAGNRLPSNRVEALLQRCYKRGVIAKGEDGCLQPADFHTRFEIWAVFEGWKDLPDDIRDRLNRWELDYYQLRHANQVDTLKKGWQKDPSKTWPAYLLLHEAEALIDRVGRIYLWPCNCRAMVNGCHQNVYTCLRFSNNRDLGWEISNSRAKEILHKSNKSGLMQNGEVSLAPDGSISGAICNCCADCCFPHQLADNLDARNLWPLARYQANHLKDRCTGCGLCVKRCPFSLFTKKKKLEMKNNSVIPEGKKRPEIIFDGDRCRGCGVCSTGCPEDAIEMVRLENVNSLIDDILYPNGA